MRLHITNINNLAGPGATSQHKTAQIAKELGFNEMGLFFYNANVDNEVELGKRIDGILASVNHGDIVVMQSPSWNLIKYDLRLVRQLKAYHNLKLVIFLHEIIPLMFNSGEDNLRKMIEVYNYADLIIAPSKEMLDFLIKYGLNVKKQMVQNVWDYPIDFEAERPALEKRMFFSGGPARFPFIKEWKYKTSLILYSNDPIELDGLNIVLHSFQKENRFLLDLSEGGYGLVWSSGEANDYYKMLQPYKVATYLAAGIPIILQKGLVSEEIILKNRLGFVVESLEEADAIVQSATESEYNEMVNRIAEFNFLIKNGWFTRKLLTDAVMWLLNDNYKPQ